MSINKNDCMDCANSINPYNIKHGWVCIKGHIIPKDDKGMVEVLDNDCEDFTYPE